MKKFIVFLLIVGILVAGLSYGYRIYQAKIAEAPEESEPCKEPKELSDGEKYEKALELIEDHDYFAAYQLLKEIGSYKDTEEILSRFHYVLKNIEAYRGGDDKWYLKEELFFDEEGFFIKNVQENADTGEQGSCEMSYDENGNLVQYIVTGPEGKEQTEYAYNADGVLIKISHTNVNGDRETEEAIYNADGKLIKVVYTTADGSKGIYDYTYDEKGNLIKEVSAPANGQKMTCTYTYDADGKMATKQIVFADGDQRTFEYTYDSYGNVAKEIRTESNGQQTVYEYFRDATGGILKEVVTSSVSGKTITEYTYDTRGKLLYKIKNDSTGTIFEYQTYSYDVNGNLIQEMDALGQTSTDYTYDDKGNLLKKITKTPDGQSSIEIAYDDDGNVVKKIIKKPDGSVYSWEMVYDGDTVRAQNTFISSTGEIRVEKGEWKLVYHVYDLPHDLQLSLRLDLFQSKD